MSVLGIDLGGSATKLAELEDGRIAGFAEAPSPVRMESLFDRDGQYPGNGTIRLERVEKIVLTGAGSSFVTGDFRGIPTVKTDEFAANAAGAREMTGLETMVVVSIGTGTSFVSVKGGKYEHIGGLAIGGGTFSGLSGVIFGHSDMGAVAEMAGRGEHGIAGCGKFGELRGSRHRHHGFRDDRKHGDVAAKQASVRQDGGVLRTEFHCPRVSRICDCNRCGNIVPVRAYVNLIIL